MKKQPLAVVDYLKFDNHNTPFIEAYRCSYCKASFLGKRSVCSKCGCRDTLKPQKTAKTGKLYSFSIVYRSYPGVQVPYISAIVDLDCGTSIKGNLIGVKPEPKNIAFDLPVELIFDDALGRKDADGISYISYFFKPLNGKGS